MNDTAIEGARAAVSREAKVDIVALLDSSDDELMNQYGHWYIPRRRPEYLRRNALVVLGNSQSGADPEVERVLANCLASTHALVRSHAVWPTSQDATGVFCQARNCQPSDPSSQTHVYRLRSRNSLPLATTFISAAPFTRAKPSKV